MAAARHQYEIYIRATPEQVWEALLDPAFTRQYFHGTAFDLPPVQGEPFRTSLPDGYPAVDGTVEVLDPPRTLVHTWHTLYDAELAAEPVSRVEWHVEPAGEGLTRVRLIHGDLAQSPKTWANVEHGWVWILDSLKSLLETGQPLPPAEATADRDREPEAEWHRFQAVESNNSAWELIQLPDAIPTRWRTCCAGPTPRRTTGTAPPAVRRPTLPARTGCSPRCTCSPAIPRRHCSTPVAA